MGNGSEIKSHGAHALRAAGFVPLPRLWVRPEDLDLVYYMAEKHSAEISAIRARVIRENAKARKRQEEIDAAWAAQRKAEEE
jgi:hypothetical protein